MEGRRNNAGLASLGWPRCAGCALGEEGLGGRAPPTPLFLACPVPGTGSGLPVTSKRTHGQTDTDRSTPRAQQRPPGPSRPRHALAHWSGGACDAWLPAPPSVPSGGDAPGSGREQSRRFSFYKSTCWRRNDGKILKLFPGEP